MKYDKMSLIHYKQLKINSNTDYMHSMHHDQYDVVQFNIQYTKLQERKVNMP